MSSQAGASSSSGLERLGALLLDDGGLMATLVGPHAPGRDGDGGDHGQERESLGELVARGPRAAGAREEYELLVEAIYEGYLLHYGVPRLIHVGEADMRLLAGDRLYAIGLARLVSLGDTEAVAELADTITMSALAHGSGRLELAEAVWAAGARAVGWGASRLHAQAKELLFAGDPGALAAMRTSISTAIAAS